MTIVQLNNALQAIAHAADIPTIEAVFDGFDSVKIVLSTAGYYEGLTRNCYVPLADLTGDYDFEWIIEEAKALKEGRK